MQTCCDNPYWDGFVVYVLNRPQRIYEVPGRIAKTLNISVAILALATGCRLERREDFDFTPSQPMRCGIFKSYYFVRDVKEEIYPDLGIVLANANRLKMSTDQHADISGRARTCTELCEVRKDNLRIMQEEIKRKLALNEIRGNLNLLAKEVREFEAAKKEWLKEHAARYREGVSRLSEDQRALWVTAEKSLKPLPAPPGT